MPYHYGTLKNKLKKNAPVSAKPVGKPQMKLKDKLRRNGRRGY